MYESSRMIISQVLNYGGVILRKLEICDQNASGHCNNQKDILLVSKLLQPHLTRLS